MLPSTHHLEKASRQLSPKVVLEHWDVDGHLPSLDTQCKELSNLGATSSSKTCTVVSLERKLPTLTKLCSILLHQHLPNSSLTSLSVQWKLERSEFKHRITAQPSAMSSQE